MARPDFSDYVVHFTKDKQPHGLNHPNHANDEGLLSITKMSAKDRLLDILMEQSINATPMPWSNKRAVCFTECTWSSLRLHAKEYSCYGLGFSKEFLFNREGNPVMYLRPDLFEEQKNFVCAKAPGLAYSEKFETFLVPFVPEYTDQTYRDAYLKGKFFDYTHEREWRVASSLVFDYNDLQFVIIGTNDDLEYFSPAIENGMEINKFLIMKNYEQVEKFWPTHIAD